MHCERREYPTLYTVIVERLVIADIIFIGTWLAFYHNAKNIQDGIAMAVERRTLQRISTYYTIIHPLLVQFLQGQFATGPKRINNPDVLVKYLSLFHACKDTKKSRAEQKIFNLFYAEREYLRDFATKGTQERLAYQKMVSR